MSFDSMCRFLKLPQESIYRTTQHQKNLLVSTLPEWKHLPLNSFSSSIYNTIALNVSSTHTVIHIRQCSTLCLDHPTQFGKLKSERKVYCIYPHFGSFYDGSSFLMFQDVLPLSKTSFRSSLRIGLLVKILSIFLCLIMSSFLTEIFV